MKIKPPPILIPNPNAQMAGGGLSVARAGRGGGTDGIGGKDSPSDGFLFLESQLCELTGLAPDRFQFVRQKFAKNTTFGGSWMLLPPGITYTKIGAEMALGLVGCTPEDVALILQKIRTAPPVPPQAIAARVWRLPLNRRVLFAKRVDSGAIVKVLMERPKARAELNVGDVIPIWATARTDEFECRLKA